MERHMIWFLTLSVSGCLVVALRTRSSARPYWTLTACFFGVAVNGFNLVNLAALSPEAERAIVQLHFVLFPLFLVFEFAFLWMFVRSLVDIDEILQKLTKVSNELQKELTKLKTDRPRYTLDD